MPLASIARIESGVETYAVGASVIARADDSSLQSLSDVAGHKVSLSGCLVNQKLCTHRMSYPCMLKFAQTRLAGVTLV